MDHRVSKDMISSGMTPSGDKSQADLGKSQYGSAPSPSRLMDAYHSMYQNQKEETLEEGKVNAGLQAYLDKKKGKKDDDDENGDEKKGKKGGKPDFLDLDKDGDKKEPMKKASKEMKKEDVDVFDLVSTKLIEEGYSEKESYEIMLNLTEEQLDEFIISGSLAALGALKAGGAALAAKGGAALAAGKGAALAAGKGALAAGKGALSAGKGLASAAKGLPSAAKGVMSKGKNLAGNLLNKGKNFANKNPILASSMLNQGSQAISNMTRPSNEKNTKKISNQSGMQTVAAGADLFDIVKGKLLDEGLDEKEIKEIMLTLTPDEILKEMEDKPMEINRADVKANTPAYQNYVKGMKSKTTGKPMYTLSQDMKDRAKGLK